MSLNKKKRKYTAIDLSVKYNAVKELEKGMSKAEIAKAIGVSISSVKLWERNKQALKKWYNINRNENNNLPKLKRLRKPLNDKVDEAVWHWFLEQRRAGIAIHGGMVKEQALQFWQDLGGAEQFNASDGWLGKWKKRHGIKHMKLCSEELSIDITDLKPNIVEAWSFPILSSSNEECLNNKEISNVPDDKNEDIDESPVIKTESDDYIVTLIEKLDEIIEHCSDNSHYKNDHVESLIKVRKIMKAESLI